MSQRLYPAFSLERAKAAENLGLAHFHMENFEQALHYFYQTDSLLRIVFKREEVAEVGACLDNIGLALMKLGDSANALLALTQGNGILKKFYAANNMAEQPKLAKSYTHLSEFYAYQSDLQQSARYALLAYETMRKLMGDEHTSLVETLCCLAHAYEKLDDIDNALYYMEKSHVLLKQLKASKQLTIC